MFNVEFTCCTANLIPAIAGAAALTLTVSAPGCATIVPSTYTACVGNLVFFCVATFWNETAPSDTCEYAPNRLTPATLVPIDTACA